jgi:hypothetical protein
MDPVEGAAAPLPAAAAPIAPVAAVYRTKLSAFWPSNPASWFATMEGQFFLDGIVDETVKYYMVLRALPESTVDLISDLVEGPLPEQPYTQLKARLLAAHQLSDYQKVEKLSQIPPLGAQKPSELLAAMLKLCPRGQEGSPFFTFFFLHRLPRQLRVLLSDEDHADRRALAVKADRLWAHNAQHAHDIVASVSRASDDEETVVAVARNQKRAGQPPTRQVKKTGYRSLSAADKKAVADSGMCYYHWAFADNAKICRKPCSWAEN